MMNQGRISDKLDSYSRFVTHFLEKLVKMEAASLKEVLLYKKTIHYLILFPDFQKCSSRYENSFTSIIYLDSAFYSRYIISAIVDYFPFLIKVTPT